MVVTPAAVARIKAQIDRRAGDQIPGSFLGICVKREFPGLNIQEYGGIKRFAADHLASVVEFAADLEGPGGSPIFRRVAESESPSEDPTSPIDAPATEAPTSPIQDQGELWSAFASTRSSHRIAYDPATREVSLYTGSAAPAGTLEVSALKHNELRQIVEDFLPHASEPYQTQLRNVLESGPNYFAQWIATLRAFPDTSVMSAWYHHRLSRIEELFKKRLIECGASIERAQELAERLRIAQKAASITRRVTAAVAREHATTKVSTSATQASADNVPAVRLQQAASVASMRQLSKAILDEMSYAEIRALQVPLGSVFDALSKSGICR